MFLSITIIAAAITHALLMTLAFALWLIDADPFDLAQIIARKRPRPTVRMARELGWLRTIAAAHGETAIRARERLDEQASEIAALKIELKRMTHAASRLLDGLIDGKTEEAQREIEAAIEQLLREPAIAEELRAEARSY